jgi:hypothetical protein
MGTRTGKPVGRPKGSANKASVARAEEVEASGLTPLDFMLGAMRDEEQPINIRLDAAKAAAQYVHPKLSAVEVKAEVSTKSNDDARTVRAGLLLVAPDTGTSSDPGGAQ